VVKATVDIVQCYCVVLEIIVVTTTVDVVQWYCFLCGGYCGYSNSRYGAMVLSCVWSVLWLCNRRYSAMLLCCVGGYCG